MAFLIVSGLFWNYTETIKQKNAVEHARILSNERMQQAVQERSDAKIEADSDERTQSYLVQFRKDCETDQQENMKEASDYINGCISQNHATIEYCMGTQTYSQVYLPLLDQNWLQTCLDTRMSQIKL